jgi:hypothetical protein
MRKVPKMIPGQVLVVSAFLLSAAVILADWFSAD